MKTYEVKEWSGCFTVGEVEFAGGGFDDDKTRAQEYCNFINRPQSEQTQRDFFALRDVVNQQEAQKRSRYGTPVHRMAYERICELAKQTAAPLSIFNPREY